MVVIAGRPNAGKSSLLNALAGREAAIVTDIAGTTRDVLREHIHRRDAAAYHRHRRTTRAADEVERLIGIERTGRRLTGRSRAVYGGCGAPTDAVTTLPTSGRTLSPVCPKSTDYRVVRNRRISPAKRWVLVK